jgi:general secretion pathway protein D
LIAVRDNNPSSASPAVVAWLVCAALFIGAAAVSAAEEERVTLNFVNADIEAVATALGQMLNRNFLIDPRVKGSVNIVSSQPVPLSAAYDIFLSALRLQGYATAEAGGVTKILPEAEARLHLRGVAGRGAAAGDRLQTQVYVLKYESANQLIPVLRPIISPNNTITAYPANNSLVITDYADNLRRIDRIIDAIDRPGGGEPVVIPLRFATATELADTVTRILAEGPGAAGVPAEPRARTVVAGDARTNSLIVRSDNPARIARVQAIVQQLDVPTGAAGNIHVVYLKNAEAARVAQTLRAILSGDPAVAPTAAATTLPATPGQSPSAAASTLAVPAGAGMVQADPPSNAVIISAPDAVFANLRAVIEKLDVRRAQVYVEALIVEITADKAAEFGVQWQSVPDLSSNQTRPFGGTNFGARGTGTNIIDAAGNLSSLGSGLNIGLVKGQITLPGVGTVTNLVALARALETDAKANILSTPNLLTLDNEEARIVVGQNVPFITGQYAQTGAAPSVSPFQTIERRDVGLTLRVKPQISEGGTVRLQIYQEVSSVQDRSFLTGVITNKRSLESTVLVDDGQIVVLGGLVQDGIDTVVEKVPVLGDIPLLGLLFRYETRRQTKTNLMVFLRPMVMREAGAPRELTSQRYRQMLEEQNATQPPRHPVLPDVQTPRLPESADDQ